MITVKSNGDFFKSKKYLTNVKKAANPESILHKYGKLGVNALNSATPVKSGSTASSWYYEVTRKNGKLTLSFNNSNIQNGCPIAIILQYGYGTGTGGWVEGRDYINPAIRPIFDQIANDAWREVTRL